MEIIKSYYLTNSRKNTGSIIWTVDRLTFSHRHSARVLDVTAIHHNTELGLVFVGDAKSRSVRVYDRSLQLVRALKLTRFPAILSLSVIGLRCSHQSLDPIDGTSGEVGFINESGLGEYQPILKGLNRPTRYVPFDHSGDNYAVLCEFGIRKGKITLYRGGESHLVFSMSGAIDCRVLDADSDGQPEVYILVAQEHECLIRLTLSPSGTVDQKVLIKKHPVGGSLHGDAWRRRWWFDRYSCFLTGTPPSFAPIKRLPWHSGSYDLDQDQLVRGNSFLRMGWWISRFWTLRGTVIWTLPVCRTSLISETNHNRRRCCIDGKVQSSWAKPWQVTPKAIGVASQVETLMAMGIPTCSLALWITKQQREGMKMTTRTFDR